MRKAKGQVLVELALVLPLLLVLILGMVDFGLAMYTKNSLNNAARSGVRTAVVTPSLLPESGAVSNGKPIATIIKKNLFSGIPDTVTYELTLADSAGTILPGPASPNNVVTVTVTYANFPLTFYKILSIITTSTHSNSLTLKGHAAMRYE